MVVRIRPARVDEWQALRDLRLEMLSDTPSAYMERYEDAAHLDDHQWRQRAERGAQSAAGMRWVAEAPDGRWVGTLSTSVDGAGGAYVFAVYVAPAYRGRGVADRLLDEAIRWAQEEARVVRLVLQVHEDNGRARSFYRRRGFVETGRTEPYALDPSRRELEMALTLRRHAE